MNLVRDYLLFDRMLTPLLVKVVYALGQAGITLWCLSVPFAMAAGSSLYAERFNVGAFFLGMVVAVFTFASSSMVWRITCELVIVVFKIFENTRHFPDTTGRPPSAPPATRPDAAPDRLPAWAAATPEDEWQSLG